MVGEFTVIEPFPGLNASPISGPKFGAPGGLTWLFRIGY